jgi:hypothetical protein
MYDLYNKYRNHLLYIAWGSKLRAGEVL